MHVLTRTSVEISSDDFDRHMNLEARFLLLLPKQQESLFEH